MNYLLELGINKNSLEKIINHNGEAIYFSIESNVENITNIINYLKSINIKNIDELLIYEIDFFLNNYEDIKNKITKYDIDKINNINNDCTYIENI